MSSTFAHTHAGITSERKIDSIARGIEEIQRTLQSDPAPATVATSLAEVDVRTTTPIGKDSDSVSHNRYTSWDHSAHIKNFIKEIVDNHPLYDCNSDNSEVVRHLKQILELLEQPETIHSLPYHQHDPESEGDHQGRPPFEAAVDALRFAKSMMYTSTCPLGVD